MATIYSTEAGQVVEAKDAGGTYYYLADGLGAPTVGYWLSRDAAVATLEGGEEAPACDGEINEDGHRLVNGRRPVAAGYVVTDRGEVLVQVPDPNSRWGFFLADDDQSWDGGFGVAGEWDLVADDDPRITDEDRDRLGWILDEHRA